MFSTHKGKVNESLLCSLDVGTREVKAAIAKKSAQGLEIVGFGTAKSTGLKAGAIIDIEAAIHSIREAVQEAEKSAQTSMTSTYASLTGSPIHSIHSSGIVGIKHMEVFQQDVDRVIDAARAVRIGSDKKVLHILPQEYQVDDQQGVREPIGMAGVRLEVNAHIITSTASSVQNMIKCIEGAGIDVEEIIINQLASSEVLTQDEKDLGVCMVDIGGGTSDIAVYSNGFLRHAQVIPIAGDQITNDLSMALHTPNHLVEKIKIEHGCTLDVEDLLTHTVKVPSFANGQNHTVPKKLIAQVMEARIHELFELIAKSLAHADLLDHIPAGIVLTGGSAQIPGIVALGERVFRMPVSVASHSQTIGHDRPSSPQYATALGLLSYMEQSQRNEMLNPFKKRYHRKVWSRVVHWVEENF